MTRHTPAPERLAPGLWRFADTCNVYLIRDGESDGAIAIDYGSGVWTRHLPTLGIRRLEHIFLTHHHADQGFGLQKRRPAGAVIHAPAGEQPFLDPAALREGVSFASIYRGCPSSYAILREGLAEIRYDLAGFCDYFWGRRRIRFLHTPGHGSAACSVVLDHHGRQLVFCGDACHAGGTIHQPYHLEWDHWTGGGALAAWEGVRRLQGIAIDALYPAHGPAITHQPRAVLQTLARRLLTFVEAKGQIAPGEPDGYLDSELLACGARRLLPDLFQLGNGALLRSRSGEALIVDPCSSEMPLLDALLAELGGLHPTAATVSHYHADHCDGIPYLRQRYGTRVWMHPCVAAPLRDVHHGPLRPWLPHESIRPDHLWPARGDWQWNEYRFRVAPWPGQTCWHTVSMTTVNDRRVMFGGDSFQPPSRWNGTGGFCAYNRSTFADGFAASARLALAWRPELLVNGHNTAFAFRPSHFRKIIAWSQKAAAATRALCPQGELDDDYYAIAGLSGRYRAAVGALGWLTPGGQK
jgi:glyoxylase-like metal-dependent hydrolase (beta-lactamase superfamily II)